MSITPRELFASLDVLAGVIVRIYNQHCKGKRIVKYEVNFADMSDLPGNKKAMLTIKIWFSNRPESQIIEHLYLIDGRWQKG